MIGPLETLKCKQNVLTCTLWAVIIKVSKFMSSSEQYGEMFSAPPNADLRMMQHDRLLMAFSDRLASNLPVVVSFTYRPLPANTSLNGASVGAMGLGGVWT